MPTSVHWIVELRVPGHKAPNPLPGFARGHSLALRRSSGFTLIELLAVIALSSAIAGLVIVSMGTWFNKMKARAEAAEIHASVKSTIKMALLKAQPLVIAQTSGRASGAVSKQFNSVSHTEVDLALPKGWMLTSGAVEVTLRGYCKGGVLVFSSSTSQVQLSVEAVTCSVTHAFRST